MVPIGFQSTDFPFTILDVAHLLRLNIRRRGTDHVYVDCPICGDKRGKMNLNIKKNVWRCNYCDEGGGMLALYAKVYGISNSDAYREICDTLQTGDFAPDYEVKGKAAEAKEMPEAERASVQMIHQTLSMLLSMLSLTEKHREHLRTVRGLSDAEIEKFGFKSTPPAYLCRSLTERLMKQGCIVEGVPGFYINDSDKWTVKFHQRTSGILIPVRGVDGMIRGAQIRLDHPIKAKDDPPEKDGTKYLWLASTGKNRGVSSETPVHFVGDPCARVVYVTEGPLKANIAHALMDRTFAAIAGANNVAKLDELFAFLSQSGTEEIIETQDMDKYSNKMVDKGASKIYLMAREHGLACRRLTWDPNYKGIDDWRLALRRKEKEQKEAQRMNFKEKYLLGLCGLETIEDCTERWHQLPEQSMGLVEYLGLTEREYAVFLQGDLSTTFQSLLDSQRRYQKFRIYQLDLENGKTIPFAFAGIDALRKAGHEQPPASEYRLVFDGEIVCPAEYTEQDVLELICSRYSGELPEHYHGRSVSPSDVVELCSPQQRSYFYRDKKQFVPVRFSPMLVKSGKAAAAVTQPTPAIDGERLKNEVDALSAVIHVSQVRISAQDGQDHEADLFVFLPKGGTQEGTVTFQGRTYDEAFQSLVNTVNQKLCRYTRRVRDMQILPKTGKRYEVCGQCGGTRLYYFEFRTDYAAPGQYDPVNEGTPTITQEDVPYRVGGTYCMDCGSFCNTETRLGEPARPDVMDDDRD